MNKQAKNLSILTMSPITLSRDHRRDETLINDTKGGRC